jgi:CRP/FNR family transcriptional regulator
MNAVHVRCGLPASWILDFPCFSRLDRESISQIERGSRLVSLPSGATIFEPGQPCAHYILVRQGSVRVSLADPNGHTILLYRLGPGDSCILTTAAILSGEPYAASALTETAVQAVLIESNTFHRLLAVSDEFRRSIFSSHGKRIVELMEVVGSVVFESIDHRLAKKLIELADGKTNLLITHETLSFELGTAREVVSRRLKEFERCGWLALHKGKIEILDISAISACARQ